MPKSETKRCQNCKNSFVIDGEDFGFYEKVKVPLPTFCPECRMQRRHAWKNNTSLYNRRCDLCQKSVVTIYSKESGITIYCNKCWWSDKWDPKSYGQGYDFSRPFFEQIKALSLKVPHMALINDDGIASINCEYTQDFSFGKNCYMTFVAWYIENVMYSYFILAGKDMMDCTNIRNNTEWMYECINCGKSFNLRNTELSKACVDSSFLYNCMNCSDCFMCSGLRNKKYHYRNKKYSKQEYNKILESYELHTYSGVERAKKEYDEFIKNFPRRFGHLNNCVNSTGYLISSSRNCKDSFLTKDSENSKYCDLVGGIKESYDLAGGGEMSECYENVVGDHSSRNLFGLYSWKSQDIEYTQHCHDCKNVFGCIGLRKAKYCIFNKQYTKEEYEKLVPQIIEQMNQLPYLSKMGNTYRYGEFYPIELSPFGYNETLALEQFPLSEGEVIKKGYTWQGNLQKTTGKETLSPENIPESISEVDESILNEVLACVSCHRNYRIVPNELIFYKKMQIPIPRRCFYCRHMSRVKRQNPFKLWDRNCMCTTDHPHHKGKCKVEFKTSYAPDRPEIVYCEKCYQAEVY